MSRPWADSRFEYLHAIVTIIVVVIVIVSSIIKNSNIIIIIIVIIAIAILTISYCYNIDGLEFCGTDSGTDFGANCGAL